MIKGIPYFKENNAEIHNRIFTSTIENHSKITMYDLSRLILKDRKNYVVILDDFFLTWLDDIAFDYTDKLCFLPYYTFSTVQTDKVFNETAKNTDHLYCDEKGRVILRYDFKLELKFINIGTKLNIYSIKDGSITEYKITEYINEVFYLSEVYNRYKTACYFDEFTEKTEFEGGYTYIAKTVQGFINHEHKLRLQLGYLDFADDRILEDYRDVRCYKYLECAEHFRKVNMTNDLYKYRRLDFESYLYTQLRKDKMPVDNKEWKELGESKQFIKFKDDVPFFIKYYWLNGYEKGKFGECWR